MCITVNVLTLSYPKVAEASKGHRANTQDGIKFISRITKSVKDHFLIILYRC